MFDIGAIELLVIAVVAIIVIGPKDMPQAMRHAGRWVGKIRRVSAQFRSGFDAMVREAEMEDMEKTWKAQNARIMADSAAADEGQMKPLAANETTFDAEKDEHSGQSSDASADENRTEPRLPLDPPKDA